MLLACLLGLAGAVYVIQKATPTYRATATTFFSVTRTSSVTELSQGSTYTQGLMQSYVGVVNSPLVLQPVIDRLDLSVTPTQLGHAVSAKAPLDSVVMQISVIDPSPAQAARIANAVAAQLSLVVAQLSPVGRDLTKPVAVTTVIPAVAPKSPITPKRKLDLAVGLLLGLLLGISLALLKEMLDPRIKDAESVRRLTDVPILGTVPRARHGRKSQLRQDAAMESAFLRLRLALPADSHDGPLVLLGSSQEDARASAVASVSLARAFAESGSRTLLVDADLARRRLTELCGASQAKGLADFLLGAQPLDRLVLPFGVSGRDLLAAGTVQERPGALLVSPTMRDLLRRARSAYSVTLINAAPFAERSDALVLAHEGSQVLLVVEARRTLRKALVTGLVELQQAGIVPVGLVLQESARGWLTRLVGRRRSARRDAATAQASAPAAESLPGTSTASLPPKRAGAASADAPRERRVLGQGDASKGEPVSTGVRPADSDS